MNFSRHEFGSVTDPDVIYTPTGFGFEEPASEVGIAEALAILLESEFGDQQTPSIS